MEDSQELVSIFEKDFDIERIITELSIRSGESIFKNETLIIFDKIQACERVLLSLKYFCEKSHLNTMLLQQEDCWESF